MFYLTTMIYDVKYMRSILLEEMGCNNGVGIIEQDVNGNNN